MTLASDDALRLETSFLVAVKKRQFHTILSEIFALSLLTRVSMSCLLWRDTNQDKQGALGGLGGMVWLHHANVFIPSPESPVQLAGRGRQSARTIITR